MFSGWFDPLFVEAFCVPAGTLQNHPLATPPHVGSVS